MNAAPCSCLYARTSSSCALRLRFVRIADPTCTADHPDPTSTYASRWLDEPVRR